MPGTTFSTLVEKIVTATGRAERRPAIKKYVNATIKECQVQANFYRDLYEDSLTPDADPYIWTFPSNFRVFRSADYPGICKALPNLPPGRIQEGKLYFYYAAGNYMTFAGAGDTSTISVAYYQYQPKLLWYDETLTSNFTAPALYDEDTDTWSYLSAGAYVASLATTDLEDAAKALVTNWLLMFWDHAIEEGALAKLYQALDDPRAPKVYSVFKSMKSNILQGESFESMNL